MSGKELSSITRWWVVRAFTTGAEGPGFNSQLVLGIFRKLSLFTHHWMGTHRGENNSMWVPDSLQRWQRRRRWERGVAPTLSHIPLLSQVGSLAATWLHSHWLIEQFLPYLKGDSSPGNLIGLNERTNVNGARTIMSLDGLKLGLPSVWKDKTQLHCTFCGKRDVRDRQCNRCSWNSNWSSYALNMR